MKKIFLVYGHYNDNSFNAAIRDEFIKVSKYKGNKVMTYTMVRKTKLVPPTLRYLNIVKQGYKDCKINFRSLNTALQPVKHLQR